MRIPFIIVGIMAAAAAISTARAAYAAPSADLIKAPAAVSAPAQSN